jgi:hypothetical protein
VCATPGSTAGLRLKAAPFKELNTWVTSFRQLWEERLDSLDGYLQQVAKQERDRRRK